VCSSRDDAPAPKDRNRGAAGNAGLLEDNREHVAGREEQVLLAVVLDLVPPYFE